MESTYLRKQIANYPSTHQRVGDHPIAMVWTQMVDQPLHSTFECSSMLTVPYSSKMTSAVTITTCNCDSTLLRGLPEIKLFNWPDWPCKRILGTTTNLSASGLKIIYRRIHEDLMHFAPSRPHIDLILVFRRLKPGINL